MSNPGRPPASLQSLASTCGIEPSFVDAIGKRRVASPDTLRRVLNLLDVSAERAGTCDLPGLAGSPPERWVEPVLVQWGGKAGRVRLDGRGRKLTAELTRWQDDFTGTVPLPKSISGQLRIKISAGEAWLAIPGLPFGYYRLEIGAGRFWSEALLISSPVRAYSPGPIRAWGLFLPMYAAQVLDGWGAGNFATWRRLASRARELGASVLATLPLLPAFIDRWKCEPSPYSPVSRLFWNEFFVDPTGSPEFAATPSAQALMSSPAFQRDLGKLRKNPLVDYRAEMALKRRVLEKLADQLFSRRNDRRAALDQFQRQNPRVADYAVFRAACEEQQRGWQQWPERARGGELRESDYPARTFRFYLYSQWLAHEQINALARRRGDGRAADVAASAPLLYLDLPLGVDADGYDVWRNRDSFVLGASAGAPPDAFFTRGQDWGFPPLHPQRIREQRYRYVIEYLRFQMRHTGLLRLDHVMGLHRLWWVPQGASPAEGAYVRYHAAELYAILCLESHRHQTMLVGENLGTVPPEVNRAMEKHGLGTMYVVQYEANPESKPVLRLPPPRCVASLNTHDMPAWSAHWHGADIADRRDLGLLDAPDVPHEARRRAMLRRALERFLRREKLLQGQGDERKVLAGLLRFLGRSPADLVLVNLEDLWLEKAPQNTPGTSTERINWRRKTARPFEEMLDRPAVRELLEALRRT